MRIYFQVQAVVKWDSFVALTVSVYLCPCCVMGLHPARTVLMRRTLPVMDVHWVSARYCMLNPYNAKLFLLKPWGLNLKLS